MSRRRDYTLYPPSSRILRSNPAASTHLLGDLPGPTRRRRGTPVVPILPPVPILEAWNPNASRRSSTSARHSGESARLSLHPTISLLSSTSTVSSDFPDISARSSIASEWAPLRRSSSSYSIPSATSVPSLLDDCIPIDGEETHFMLQTPTGERILSSFVKMMESPGDHDKKCPICHDRLDEELKKLAILQCGHYMHFLCLMLWFDDKEEPKCFICGAELERVAIKIKSARDYCVVGY